MHVQIKPEHEKFIREQVASGMFVHETDVVCEALEAMRSAENFTPDQVARFRMEVAKGQDDYDAGRFSRFDAEKLITEERPKKGNRVC